MCARPPWSGVVLLSVVVLGTVMLAGGVGGQEVRARVVDRDSRQAIEEAVATLKLLDGSVVGSAVSDDEGFFRVRTRGRGTYTLEVERLGYARETRDISVSGEDSLTLPAFVLTPEVIALDSMEVEARSRRGRGGGVVTAARSSHVISGARLATIEAGAGSLRTVLRELPGLRVREWMDRNGRLHFCVESTRRLPTFAGAAPAGCTWVVFVIDGIAVDETMATTLIRTPGLAEYESLEYLTPLEAGTHYGMDASANGAVVIWTRGRGPHASAGRNRS